MGIISFLRRFTMSDALKRKEELDKIKEKEKREKTQIEENCPFDNGAPKT